MRTWLHGAITAVTLHTGAVAASPPEVLFIAIDDLNDWVGCLGGHPQALTPNIDRLAGEGVLFTNAHCQAPICGPSRASIMTGLAPTTSGIYLQIDDRDIRNANPATRRAVFLPDYFENHGYTTRGAGKIYHKGDAARTFDEFGHGTNMGPKPKKRFKWDPKAMGLERNTQTDWAAYPERDAQMPDFKTAAYAMAQLRSDRNQPLFLAAGFVRPHVPWYVPAKWFAKHPVADIETPPYRADDMDDVPAMARKVAEVPMMPTTEWAIAHGEWKAMLQAYLACVTFVDAQVGKVLDALEESGRADRTVVVLWSDHGYHLGEKNRFAKQAIWERDTHVPLIIRAPGIAGRRRCDAPVQLLDLYPTLLELCGLPPNPQNDGHSLVPLLEDPEADWPHLAVTSYGAGNVSIRNRSHRYIVYEDGSEELYDLRNDPNEWTNLADRPASEALKKALSQARPTKPAPLADKSRYDINPYWRQKTAARKKGER
ncbi:sulfatase [Haloferula sp. A504]|uniref:sulfatase n=1 Tax=Haloferula sp. A504 TaxID=3373601 RepID=UPI0031C5FB7C|nr:sulfatase [Verrucomicrobiaceae bacterium E54]